MRFVLLAVVVIGWAFVGWAVDSSASAQDVRVTLRGVEARPGKILATLTTEAEFMRGRGPYALALDPPAANGDLVLVFEGVAPGDYALSVMHDEDGNFQMRANDAGMPLEGWAMSHGAAMAGPPTFATAKFNVGADPVSFSEEMFYPYVPPGQ